MSARYRDAPPGPSVLLPWRSKYAYMMIDERSSFRFDRRTNRTVLMTSPPIMTEREFQEMNRRSMDDSWHEAYLP